MNEFLSSPALLDSQAFAVRLALAGVCVCAMLLVAARLLRRRSEPLQYGILFGGVIGLLAVPALVGVGQIFSLSLFAPPSPPEDEILRIPMEMLPDLLHGPAEPLPEEAAPPSLAGPLAINSLALVWAYGVAFGLARLMRAIWKQNRAFIRQPWHAPFWTDELKARLAHQLGLQRFPEVDVAPAVPMPMVIGIWRPVIVLPAASPASWGLPQWEAVLLHEAAHIARGDHWAALAQRFAVMLFWWCPLVYPLSRRLNELRENICDDFALQGPCDQIAYAELLVESAESLVRLKIAPVSLALLDSAHGGLETRITRLLAKEKRTMTKLSLSGKLFAATFLVGACLLTLAATAFSGGAQATAQKKVQIKIIIDGKEIDITDAKLLEHLEAVQKKDVKVNVIVKELSKDGGPGIVHTRPLLVDPIAGPIAAIQLKDDARVDALVKQAEAIKPGSGAEVRKALQGSPKKLETRITLQAKPDARLWDFAPAAQAWKAIGDKKVIILQIEDGKVVQLNDADLKKLLEKGFLSPNDARFYYQLVTKAVPPPPVALPAPVRTLTKPVPPPPPGQPDLQNLQRQLERITADLQELRNRLDAGSKK